MELYENIRKRRKLLKMTQTDLALKIGYADKSMISHIENGEVDIPVSKIADIAKALRIPPGDLMGDPDKIIPTISTSLLNKIEQLNEEGQNKVESYTDGLLENDKYKKDTPSPAEADAS